MHPTVQRRETTLGNTKDMSLALVELSKAVEQTDNRTTCEMVVLKGSAQWQLWSLTFKLRWKISDGQYLLHNILIHPSTFQQFFWG